MSTSLGPGTGKAATGRPLASASSITRPKVSVSEGKTKTSAEAWAEQLLALDRACEEHFGMTPASSPACGPGPTSTLGPEGRREEGLDVFLHRDAADIEEHRPVLAEAAHICRGRNGSVSTPRDQRMPLEARACNSSASTAWRPSRRRRYGTLHVGVARGLWARAAAPRHIPGSACDSWW